jgi:hypothetical protein
MVVAVLAHAACSPCVEDILLRCSMVAALFADHLCVWLAERFHVSSFILEKLGNRGGFQAELTQPRASRLIFAQASCRFALRYGPIDPRDI